jgi:6-phosphogluconolactonase/glucosamine-6-phosphate isomerase/deaminase
MRTVVCRSQEVLNCQAARIIADVLCGNPKAAFTFATGGTPMGAYRELLRLSTEGLSTSPWQLHST